MLNQHILVIFLALLMCQKGWSQLEANRRLPLGEQNQAIPLQIREAFPYHVSVTDPGKYLVTWNLAPGHYLYGHAFQFKLIQGQGDLELPVDFKLPQGLEKSDEFFGDIEAFYGNISVSLSLPTVLRPETQLVIEYQGCADWGFCYPPQSDSQALVP